MQECLRGPSCQSDGVAPGQAGDVYQPNACLDTDGGAHAEYKLIELLLGELTADTFECLGDPGDCTTLTEGERLSFGGVASSESPSIVRCWASVSRIMALKLVTTASSRAAGSSGGLAGSIDVAPISGCAARSKARSFGK